MLAELTAPVPRTRLVIALVIAALAAWIGHQLTVAYYGPRLAAAHQFEQAYGLLADTTRRQNEAITAIEESAARRRENATTAVAAARSSATGLRLQAEAILRIPPPAGADTCQAASAAFDNELRQERGQ